MQHKKNVSISSLPPILSSAVVMSSTGSDEDLDAEEFINRRKSTSFATTNSNNNNNNNRTSIGGKKRVKNAKNSNNNNNWEVIEGYRDANKTRVSRPENFEGYLLKRRMWPMRGWHKRYFILQDGTLVYGKSKQDLFKQKLHGSIKIYLAMVSYLTSSRRIHIDSSPQSIVCHLKAKTQQEFEAWIEHIKQHRLYHHYQITSNNISSGGGGRQSVSSALAATASSLVVDTMDSISNRTIVKQTPSETHTSYKPQVSFTSESTIDTSPIHQNTNQKLINIDDIDLCLRNVEESLEALIKSYCKDQPTTPTHNRNHSTDYQLGLPSNSKVHISKSNPNLINEIIQQQQQQQHQNNQTQSISPVDEKNGRVRQFYAEAKTITEQLKQVHRQLARKNELCKQTNMKLATRSQSILSNVSLQDSQLQFYDAIENLSSDDEDTDEDDDSDLDEGQTSSSSHKNNTKNTKLQPSKPIVIPELDESIEEELLSQKILKRRSALPAPCPDTSQVGLFSILRKAIGKDLSKISLPVVLNEPLSILQRLSEEIEYSELLDTANTLSDPYDRMVYVAAFIISGYSSSHYRNGCKNFNPLLGETYELIRPDKGWKYFSEQVSHHPPISSTHCQSKSFIHEQVFHAKIKFWGKSMEVHPNGYTRLTLTKFNETYQWNKIVMYIYNLMSKDRRIEHCGEITVRCTNGVSCRITFPKAGNERQRNEFFGDIIYENVVKRRVFGQWHDYFSYGHENTAKTIWRMGSVPEDASLYYGFTRFAIELNEITDDVRTQLPPTDSRYRPDQRFLELGKVDLAEDEKQRIEETQRTRRRLMDSRNEHHKPMWFHKSDENDEDSNEFESNGLYWLKREQPGFNQMKDNFVKLW